MNKNIWLSIMLILLSMLGYFLYTNPSPYTEITFLKRENPRKLPPPAPLVKDIQLDRLVEDNPSEEMKRELKDLKVKVTDRDLLCEENSQQYFSKGMPKNIFPKRLNEVFEKTFRRGESDQAFAKALDLLNSNQIINMNAFVNLISDLEICRPKASLQFLDKVIESLNGASEEYREKIAPILIKNIKDILLGENYSPINLGLVFGKLSRLISYKIIKEPNSIEILALRDHFLSYEAQARANFTASEEKEQIREMLRERFNELREISIELKHFLGNI